MHPTRAVSQPIPEPTFTFDLRRPGIKQNTGLYSTQSQQPKHQNKNPTQGKVHNGEGAAYANKRVSGNHAVATTSNCLIPKPEKERVQCSLNLERPAPNGAACAVPRGKTVDNTKIKKKSRRNVWRSCSNLVGKGHPARRQRASSVGDATRLAAPFTGPLGSRSPTG
jgi:hypothetical protein